MAMSAALPGLLDGGAPSGQAKAEKVEAGGNVGGAFGELLVLCVALGAVAPPAPQAAQADTGAGGTVAAARGGEAPVPRPPAGAANVPRGGPAGAQPEAYLGAVPAPPVPAAPAAPAAASAAGGAPAAAAAAPVPRAGDDASGPSPPGAAGGPGDAPGTVPAAPAPAPFPAAPRGGGLVRGDGAAGTAGPTASPGAERAAAGIPARRAPVAGAWGAPGGPATAVQAADHVAEAGSRSAGAPAPSCGRQAADRRVWPGYAGAGWSTEGGAAVPPPARGAVGGRNWQAAAAVWRGGIGRAAPDAPAGAAGGAEQPAVPFAGAATAVPPQAGADPAPDASGPPASPGRESASPRWPVGPAAVGDVPPRALAAGGGAGTAADPRPAPPGGAPPAEGGILPPRVHPEGSPPAMTAGEGVSGRPAQAVAVAAGAGDGLAGAAPDGASGPIRAMQPTARTGVAGGSEPGSHPADAPRTIPERPREDGAGPQVSGSAPLRDPTGGAVRETAASGTVAEPRLPVDELLRLVAERARVHSGPEGTTLHLTLEPEHLGTVRLEVTWQGDAVAAYFGVDTPEARALIENGLRWLEESLRAQGIAVASLQVALGGARGGSGGQRWAEPTARPDGARPRARGPDPVGAAGPRAPAGLLDVLA